MLEAVLAWISVVLLTLLAVGYVIAQIARWLDGCDQDPKETP